MWYISSKLFVLFKISLGMKKLVLVLSLLMMNLDSSTTTGLQTICHADMVCKGEILPLIGRNKRGLTEMARHYKSLIGPPGPPVLASALDLE